MAQDQWLSRIGLFREQFSSLSNKSIAQPGIYKLTVNLLNTESDRVDNLDEEQYESFLVHLRKFMLDQEAVHFYSICNIIYRNCSNNDLKKWTACARKLWKDTLDSNPLQIKVDGQLPSLEDIIELQLYGKIVHVNLEKSEQLKGTPPPQNALDKVQVLTGIKSLLHAIEIIDNVCWHWLDSPGSSIPDPPESIRVTYK